MDGPTQELVLSLMEEDARGALGLIKGKGRTEQVTDHELALTEWARELHHCACTIADYRMAKSLARAVSNDGVALAAATEEENRAFGDRMAALQLGGLSQSTPDQLLGQNEAAMAGLTTSLMGGFTTVPEQSRPTDATEVRSSGFPGAESSKVAAARKLDSQAHLKCVACMEAKPSFDIFKAICSHYYCRSCTGRLVHDSLVDESLFPPKCCRLPFSLSTIKTLLGEEIIRKFEEKTVEHSDSNRTYCANPSCSRYLPPGLVAITTRICPSCNTETCSTCKQRAHAGLCVEGQAEILNMAKREGWQRCARCRNIVELKSGCNHITGRHVDAKYGTKTDYSTEQTKSPLGMMTILDLHNKRFRGQHKNSVSSTTVSMTLAGGGVMGNIRAMYATTCSLTSSYDASAAGLRCVWSYPSRNFPKVQDLYGKLPGIEDQPRRSLSVMIIEGTVREGDASLQHLGPSSQQVAHVPRVQEQALETYEKQHCPESVGSASCLISSQKVASKGKEERSGYERQPRHKTKNDHYEYKGKMSHEKGGGRVTKAKRRRSAKRNRKHTMNDNFHASNVARDRLTLQSNMNLGLFQMGRTSSPVKVQGPDLSFSEMKFLSNKAREDSEAACIYRDKEKSGSVYWNSPSQNTRACSSLLNTVDEQAHHQESDAFPHETSVYEHDQRSTMLQAHTDGSTQLQKKGSEGITRTATVYTWPESVHGYSALDVPYQRCTRQLLSINLDVRDNNEAITTVNPTRDYWSLEELKCLSDQRNLPWDSDAHSSTMPTNASSHWRSRKCKRPQSVGEGEPSQTPRMAKEHNSKDNTEVYGGISIPAANHHDPASEPPTLPRSGGETDGVSVHISHGQPAPASPQAFDQADIIEPPTSDFTLYPGTSSFISSSLHIQKPTSVMQSHDSYGLKEAKNSTASALISDNDKPSAQFANMAVPLPGGDCALIAQTLSAAYDVIMHPEQDPLYKFPRHRMVDTPMRDASSGVGGNGNIFQAPEDYHGLPDDLASYWLPGIASETGIFSHGSNDSAEQERCLGLSQPNHAVYPTCFTGHFPDARYSAGETQNVRMAGAESRPTAAMVSGLQEDLLGGLKGFWREQKLY
ncbi:ariadne RING finger [Aspergillus bombycis]|uniref:Ariadne RING finger n=1 Tax=Aspergillus bombycis TaxID=109264 RepID=A0A1F7ZWM1_9EURO|nr:ariadne RING finger [Aspergillus bombycis]OGM43882.1 ariadne RING finger [Aspergillus bombycis]